MFQLLLQKNALNSNLSHTTHTCIRNKLQVITLYNINKPNRKKVIYKRFFKWSNKLFPTIMVCNNLNTHLKSSINIHVNLTESKLVFF